MGLKLRLKIEGGSGGKRGHSNMEHWDPAEVIKDAARVGRRLEGKKLVREALAGTEQEKPRKRPLKRGR